MGVLDELEDDDIEQCLQLITLWEEADQDIEKDRYEDKESYSGDVALAARLFLEDMSCHRQQREAMSRMRKVLEDERDRRARPSGPEAV